MSDNNIRRIGTREGVWFLAVLFISKILFFDIGGYIAQSGTAAYIQTALNTLEALLIFAFILYLSGDNTDIFFATESIWGKGGLKAAGVVFALLFLLDAGVMMRVYTDIISSVVLPDSPVFLIMLFLTAAVFTASFAGIGVLGAYSYVAGIVLVVSLGAILVLNIPNYEIANIYPLLGRGYEKILTGFDGIGVYADLILLFLISPYLNKDAFVKKIGVRAIIISGVIITLTTLLYIMTVEYPFSQQLTLPVLEIAFDVNLDVVFQRAEGLFFFLWIFSGFIMTSAYICIGIHSFVRGFDLKDRRAVAPAFVVIALCVALRGGTSAKNEGFYTLFYTVFSAVSFGVPIVVFGIKKFLKRRG